MAEVEKGTQNEVEKDMMNGFSLQVCAVCVVCVERLTTKYNIIRTTTITPHRTPSHLAELQQRGPVGGGGRGHDLVRGDRIRHADRQHPPEPREERRGVGHPIGSATLIYKILYIYTRLARAHQIKTQHPRRSRPVR